MVARVILNDIRPDLEKFAAALQFAQKLRQSEQGNFPTWQAWHDAIFGEQRASFGPHHKEFWSWVWDIKLGQRPAPFTAFWARGGAKSTSVERAVICVGTRNTRRYGLYVSSTQEQADKHVESVGATMESDNVSKFFPEFGQRLVGKYGASKGWRRNRLRTSTGFTIDALGLDVAARGIRVEDQRPDFIILDDIDEETDTEIQVRKKITTLTSKVLPSGSYDAAILFVQNLIHANSIATQLVNFRVDMLVDRIVSGPFPAIEGLEYTEEIQDDGRTIYKITGGEATWDGQDIEVCQNYINTFGLRAFLAECQHVVDEPDGGLFSHINFIHIPAEEVPPFLNSEVWVDPAVSSTDRSDSHGISAGGVDIFGKLYITHSWEGISTPGASIRRAIMLAQEIGATAVGVETDQGGDLWEEAYTLIAAEMERTNGMQVPKFKSAKAGSGQGSKAHRVSTMVPAYERGEILHVLNGSGHHVIRERALKRFPVAKPYDLVDSGWHLWNSLTGGPKVAQFGVSVGGEKTLGGSNITPIRFYTPENPVIVSGRLRGSR